MAFSLGVTTDLECLRLSGSKISKHPSHLVCRTPRNPTFYWGNFVQILDDGSDVARWEEVFRATFPGAKHRTFGVPDGTDLAAWRAQGYSSDTVETLISDGLPRQTECPRGYVSRAFYPYDWDLLATANVEEYLDGSARPAVDAALGWDEPIDTDQPHVPARPDGLADSPHTFATYIKARIIADRELVQAGTSAFFGCFDADGNLASSLGIVLCADGVARYRTVLTSRLHRGRGLASHLLGVAGAWAVERGATRLVICAEDTNPSARIYRKAGFSLHDTACGVARYPSPDAS